MRTLFYMSMAWLFILSEYAQRATQFVRHMNAKQTGRHARGRHRWAVVVNERDPYLPRRVVGANSHRRRQGGLTLDVYRPGMFEAAA